jgi:hypothetical protein
MVPPKHVDITTICFVFVCVGLAQAKGLSFGVGFSYRKQE